MKLPVVILLLLNMLYFFGGYEILTGLPPSDVGNRIVHNLKEFVCTVIDEGRQFSYQGFQGNPISHVFEVVTLSILAIAMVAIILTGNGKYFWNTIKRMFNPRLPEEEYDKINDTFKGKLTVLKGLEDVQLLLEQISEDMGVDEVVFRYIDAESVLIQTIEQSGYVSIVEIGKPFLNQLSGKETDEIREQVFRFSICHELTHVRHHDAMNLRWVAIFSLLIWIDGFLAMLALQYINIIPPSVLLVFKVTWLIFGSAFCRPSVWSYGFEYRADRTAMSVSGIDDSEALFSYLTTLFPQMRGHKKAKLRKIMFSRRNSTAEYAHPTVDERKKELISHNEWHWIDFIRIAVIRQLKDLPREILHG